MNLSLLNYFLYLRDVSHKIAVSADWSKCLREKVNKGNTSSFQLSLDDMEFEFSEKSEKVNLFKLSRYLKAFSEKEAFLGLISIYGKPQTSNGYLLGSLFNIPIVFHLNEYGVIDEEHSDDISFDVDNMVINYQLLLSFFDGANDNLFYDFNKVVNEIKFMFTETGSIKNLKKLNDVVSYRVKEFFYANNIKISSSDISLKEKTLSMRGSAHVDFNNAYLFAFDVPDEISTWKYLDSFCKELGSSESLDSELLNNMLSGRESTTDLNGFNNKILGLLPINLSRAQTLSLKNAFCERVSYIQGPPGTGKSHTITAIAMAALLQKKKVLIISQKDAALKVVKGKLDHFFSSFKDKDLLPYIYFDKDLKRKLKSDLERFVERNKGMTSMEIENLQRDLKRMKSVLEASISERDGLQEIIDEQLNKQFEFSENNKDFIENSVRLNRQISYSNDLSLIQLNSENASFLSLIKSLELEFKKVFQLSKFQQFKLGQLNQDFNDKFGANVDFKNLLKDGVLYSYVSKVLSLSLELQQLNSSQRRLASKRKMDVLYKEKNAIDKDVNDRLLSHFAADVEFNMLSKFKELSEDRNSRAHFDNFAKMLHFSKAEVIMNKLKSIDFDDLLSVFGLWLCDIRHIGEVLPNTKELFDLIIIDEASQVNTAEIFPILYRGKNVCVVGDEKQLGLESVGLQFIISTKEEQSVWENYLNDYIGYDKAKERDLLVTKSSFLNLITSNFSNRAFCKTMLDEHFRSMPQLANFTNNRFYDGGLRVMTETPEKALVSCFQDIKVDGQRVAGKNEEETKKVLEIIEFLHHGTEVNVGAIKRSGFSHDKSIGVMSLLREQTEFIKEQIYLNKNWIVSEENDYYIVNGLRVKCGTPEELQGDEFDCVIFSAVVDENSRNTAHYTNAKRLNVATSRAKFFTYFIYTDVSRVEFFVQYLNNFGIRNNSRITEADLIGWSYSEEELASDFEKYVAKFLQEIITENKSSNIRLFNQVPFAKKRLDFVLFNDDNKKYVAIEVDGHFHFRNGNSRIYSDEHNERMELLSRAGWNILNTPYFCWYTGGKIDENHEDLKMEKDRLKEEILKKLMPKGVSSQNGET